MRSCLCGATNHRVTTTCDKCLQPLCRDCSTIILPIKTTGDIEIKHVQCMPKKFQTEYYEAKKNE
jgi:hypothetical protein